MDQDITDLQSLIRRLHEIDGKTDPVSVEVIVDQVGRRSFGPIILLAGLVTLAPLIGDIPGVPTLMAILVALTAGQLMLGKEHFWLPGFLLNRTVSRERLKKVLDRLERPARFVDRFFHARLTRLTRGPGQYAIAVACMLIALIMPALELIPFSATAAGTALTAFGLALIAKDGYLALFSLTITIALAGFAGYQLWGMLA